MYFAIFEAIPRDAATTNVGGAFVSCWIQCATRAEAIASARKLIEAEGWIPAKEPDEIYTVDETAYPPGHVALASFKEAQIDGHAMTIHTYPPGTGELLQ